MEAERVGKTIAYLRKRAGLKQWELAEQLGVTDKAVSRWERGLGVPDQSLLPMLADVLRTDVEAILAGEFTRDSQDWDGVVLMRYSECLGPETELYGKRSVYLQVGYLMLAGIRNISIVGERDLLVSAERVLEELPDLGLEIRYIEATDGREAGADLDGHEGDFEPDVPSIPKKLGTMLVTGLDFLYGKDLSRTFRRQMTDCSVPSRLCAHGGLLTSEFFVPGEHDPIELLRSFDPATAVLQCLGRGTIAFPIETTADVLDAANLIAILERHSDELVMDLEGIARVRGK